MKKIILIFGLLITSLLLASIDIQNVIEKQPQPTMYSATLITTISGSILKTTQQTQSTIYVKNDLLRTDTETPTKAITISKAGQTWVIDANGIATEIAQEKSDITRKTPAEILSEFSFTESQTQNHTLLLTGIPKSANTRDLFSTAHFSKILVTLNKEQNTIRDINVFNKRNTLCARFLFNYIQVNSFWMIKNTTTTIYIGSQSITVSQTYTNISLTDIPDSIFDIPKLHGGTAL